MAARKGIFRLGRIPAITRGVIAAAALVLGACGKDSTGPTETTHKDPADPVATATGIRVQNNSQFTVVDVYISSCTASTWGDDRYDGALGPGESTTFDDVGAGCYDILVSGSGDVGWELSNQIVSSGKITVVTLTN